MADGPHYSPSLLSAFIECPHLLQLELSARRGERDRPTGRSDEADLIAAKGEEHERHYLEHLRARGLRIAEIDRDKSFEDAAADTIAAMRARADVIYQATFVDDGWRGRADFLCRVDDPSALGAWSYQVEDTKLAHHPKPNFLLQLCFYSEQVAHIQGRDPALMHVVLGTSDRVPFRYGDFSAYFRRVRRRFLEAAAGAATYPYPVAHCALCNWTAECERRWSEDDHLTLIPFMRRDHANALQAAGLCTVAALASCEAADVAGVGDRPFEAYRHHARLQIEGRASGRQAFELLPPETDRGLARLPRPSEGDIFFDMEGDPFFEAGRGLEYLFGIVTVGDGAPVFAPYWAHDRQQEKETFEAVMNLIIERCRRWPDLHIYHYASYEPTAMTRLMGRHGTREDALDDLLRNHVFVDLYPIVRQSMRTSLPGYSIKQVRTFFLPEAGHGGVVDAGGSIFAYERWCDTHDAGELDAIVRYNEEDCLSNFRLRAWLLALRVEAARHFGVDIPWFTPPAPPGPAAATTDRRGRQDALERALHAMAGGRHDDEARFLELLASLIQYYRREAVPEWHAYFERLDADADELIDDPEAVAGLDPTDETMRVKNSVVHTFSFPPQEHKLGTGAVDDPATKRPAGELVEVDDRSGLLRLKRGPSLATVPLPIAVVAGGPVQAIEQEEALIRVGRAALASGVERLTPYQALADVIARRPPRIRGVVAGAAIQTTDLEQTKTCVRCLEESYLFIQGPPGTGKTWRGARLIVDLLARGMRVGVTAQSHKVIHNLLRETAMAAREANVVFGGLKKASDDPETWYEDDFVHCTKDNAVVESLPSGVLLFAGTAWLFSRLGMERSLDYLFIDEAGQISLADALAVGTAARNIVLLGDPSQLAQVSTGSHPAGAERSVLEHLLGEHATIPATHGLFIEESWRLHPTLCRFVSDVFYDGRLRSRRDCERQALVCPGWPVAELRFRPVDHNGNSQRSIEEANTIANDVAALLASASVTDANGATRRLTPRDILVVAAYNQQVRCLRDHLPPDIRVGTVDKFQGQEAAVVFFSMACSSADEIPRGVEFLFSRNRLNVAISRAQCVATVVASQRLLDTPCRTVDQMRLVNVLCRLAEYAATLLTQPS